jgi:NAD(P)-dependent dehydrogenase (short-subunit alcohol dehydrogenase family)
MISGDSFADELLESIALRRWGRQDDAVGMAIFLASRAGSFVTGAILALDGGMYSVGSY